MAFPGFTASDFKVFDIAGFKPRMDAIRSRIRPKLEAAGRDLLADVARVGGAPAFAHVAKHARRTVNPPGDTWVAFAGDKRGQDPRTFLYSDRLGERRRTTAFDGTTSFVENAWWTKDGRLSATVRPGTYDLVVSRGPEYELHSEPAHGIGHLEHIRLNLGRAVPGRLPAHCRVDGEDQTAFHLAQRGHASSLGQKCVNVARRRTLAW